MELVGVFAETWLVKLKKYVELRARSSAWKSGGLLRREPPMGIVNP